MRRKCRACSVSRELIRGTVWIERARVSEKFTADLCGECWEVYTAMIDGVAGWIEIPLPGGGWGAVPARGTPPRKGKALSGH